MIRLTRGQREQFLTRVDHLLGVKAFDPVCEPGKADF